MTTKLNSIINSLNFWSDSTNNIDMNSDELPPYKEESITAVTSTEIAVKTVLSKKKTQVREAFLAVLQSGSSQEKAIVGYVYRKAYDEQLDEIATQEWKLLSLFDKGTVIQTVRTTVFDIEADREVRTPLSRFSLNVVGLPSSTKSWSDDPTRATAKLDVLASSAPVRGLPRVIARAVYPLLTNKDPQHILMGVCLPPWQLFGHRKGLADVFHGYAEAFECWVEDRNKSKLGPLTREQLFTAVNEVLAGVGGIDGDVALTIGRRLFTTYSFTLEEIVLTSAFHAQLKNRWQSYPFGATALGALNIIVPIPYHREMIVKCEWSEGFLSRYIPTTHVLTDIERRDPCGAFKLQVEDALALEDPVDRYIHFNTLVNRFKGTAFEDPVDPKTGPVDLVATYQKRKDPGLPRYEDVLAWRERNHQECPTLV